jgi:hypothetical protein
MLPLFGDDDEEADGGSGLRDSEQLAGDRSSARHPSPSDTQPISGAQSSAGERAGQANEGERIADRVLASTVFRSQERMTRGRGAPDRAGLRALLTALIDAPGRRLTQQQTATALGDHPVSVRRAVISAIRLLNVEGYPVLSLDADGTTTVLDVDLLVEQFGL